MKLHNMEQKSPEWHNLRLGKITASGFGKLLGTDIIREKYLYDRAAEIVTGERSDADEACSSIHIDRGNEYESVARDKYVVATFSEVKEVGFIQLDDYTGCSPDGLVGDDGVIEIKVPDSNNYFRHIIEITKNGGSAIPTDHFWQMQFSIYMCVIGYGVIMYYITLSIQLTIRIYSSLESSVTWKLRSVLRLCWLKV